MNHRLFTSPTVIILLVALALLLLNSSVQGAQFNQAPPAPVAEPSPTALVSGLDANNSTTEEKIIAAPASCTGLTCTILATAGWQQTPLTLQQGSPFRILYTSGSWTVDYRSFPYVGPDGYAPTVDSQITPGCKVDTMLPYAHLLGQIGSGPIFSIGMGGAFTANASGVLSLRINDADSCLEDNDGALSLQTQTEFSCANVTEIPTSECNALVALYNSTNGPNWTNRSGWLTTIMPCSWSGVSCLNGHVYLLALLDNQLRGPLPTQLGDFPDMLAIYMSGNQLSGNIPTQLGNLTKLLDLDLGNNQLSGSIPAQLGNLPNLTHLYLNVNQLNGSIPPQLGNRTSLIALNLCCNQLSGNIPPQLGNLIGLRELTLSGNQLSGNIPSQLGNLTNLTSLGLCCNQLNGNVPAQLGNLTQLTFLSLDGNQLSGSLPTQLGNLVNLIEFHLENNQSLNGALPNSLTKLTKLATFWFHNTSLCEPGDSAFQNWLASIANLNRTGVCPANITVQFGAAAYTVNENGQVGGFQEVMLSAASSQPVTVQFATSNGTATAGSDYTATNATLTFNPGETSKSFNVPILQDNLDENDETVNLTLSNPANATLGTLANAALTIFDDDPLPTVQFSNATYSISENGGSATIQVTLSPVSGRTVAVNYATSNGTATAGSDYQARSGALTFNPGETSKTFTVSIINDNVVEPDETVNLTLSSPGNADLGSPANAILTILNEDETPCYTLTTSVNPSGAGSVAANPAPNCAGNQYAQGAAVTLSATPNAGFVFAAWSGSINSTANPVSVTMDGNKNITANFNPQPLSSISGRVADANNQPIAGVTVAAGAYTALTDTNGNYTLQGVAAGTYTVTPSKSGFTFFPPARSAAVPPNATGINFAGTQTPPSCYALVTSVNPGNWGTVVTTPAPNCQGNLYTQGAVVSLTATGNPGYEFVQWNGDANDVANPLSVTMDRNKSITANFRQALFSCNNVTEIPRLECEALMAAYNSTNGPAWTNHSGWLVTLTPCSWFGVICGNNHVTELTLDANKLNGSIPTQLSNLTNLRVLDLNTNSLRGAIPGELGALANLEILDLSINYLNGAVPTQLTNLTRLTRLILGENELSGAIPPALGNLVNLVELSLDTNQLTGEIPSSLTSLTNLDTLYLSDNQLSGAIPAQLGNLTRLTTLGLDTNQLSGGLPAAVGSLVNLRYLYVDNNQLSGPLPDNLLNLAQLTFFAFHKTNLCEPADAAFQAWLAKFPASFRTNVQCVTADFTASPQSGNAPLTVAFHNSSIGSFTSCAWDYGDGATGNACTDHNHTYNAAGTYTVQLTVSGAGGTDSKTRTDYITITLRPTYSISGRVTDNRGSLIAGVKITIETGHSAITNSDGRYKLDGVFAGNHTLTPSKGSNTFSPSSRSVAVTGNTDGQDFIINCETSPATGLNSCDLEPGDILLVRGTGEGLFGEVTTFLIKRGSYFHHAAIYVGNQELTEAVGYLDDDRNEIVTHSVKDSTWWNTNTTIQDWVVLRPQLPQTKILVTQQAKEWAAAENPVIGYDIFSQRFDDTSFYCSKLVWRAYYLVGNDLEKPKWEAWGFTPDPYVTPADLYNTKSVQVQSDRSPNDKRPVMVVISKPAEATSTSLQSHDNPLAETSTITSPAHLMLVDPQGRRTGYDPSTGAIVNEIPGAIYSGTDALYENVSVTDFDGQWQVIVIGVATSDYRLVTEFLDATDPQQQFVEDSTVPGQIDQYTISAPSIAIYLPLISR